MKKILLKHVGNMGDMIFLVPPLLASLKRHYPYGHITFVTAWGFKDKKGRWGKRNMDGHCLSLMMTNPHIDQLVHWHDTKLSLTGDICQEEGRRFPTWNKAYFEQQKKSGDYHLVAELDFGLGVEENPLQRVYQAVGLPHEHYSQYSLYLTDQDKAVAAQVLADAPQPRIVLLEGLESRSTRGWDPEKIEPLQQAIRERYGVAPLWFGGRYPHYSDGRTLSLRQNIATLLYCDVAIGVMTGTLHFAASVGLPTITLHCDMPLQRSAPAYFLNSSISSPAKHHRTLLGPSRPPLRLLKNDTPSFNLTLIEQRQQNFRNWLQPGQQATKTCLSMITVEEVMTVLADVVPPLPV